MGNVPHKFAFRVALAAALGLCVGLGFQSPCCAGLLAPALSCIYVAGALFAVSVFVPYVKHDRLFWLRCLGLAVIGAFGYRCAWEAGWAAGAWHLDYASSYTYIACLTGTAIILLGARLLIPLRHSFRLAIAGSVAGIAGGFILSSKLGNSWVAWGLWHAVMATAIYGAQDWALPSREAK